MEFGLPAETADQPTFFRYATVTSSSELDDEGVPYDPGATLTGGEVDSLGQVECAIEYIDGEGKVESFAVLAPAKVKLTMLDTEYDQVWPFNYVVIKGQKYYYQRSEPPVALGTVDVHTLYCRAEDEG